MSRILRCGMIFCGESFAAELVIPDEYFDDLGRPLYHKLNPRLSAHPIINYNIPIGGVCEKVPDGGKQQ